MKYFLSILGLGDTLITSRILDSYPSEITDNISIITSTYGINIVKKFSKLHSITAITEKIPRFYNVSDNSIPIVINSLLQFRDQINKFLEPGDLIIHEKQLGLRELFLRLGSKGHNIYPQYISNVYLDRVKLFNKVLNYEVDLSGYRLQYEKRKAPKSTCSTSMASTKILQTMMRIIYLSQIWIQVHLFLDKLNTIAVPTASTCT